MKKLWKWFFDLPKRIKDSIAVSASFVGFASTVMSILGYSLKDWTNNGWFGLIIVLAALVLIYLITYSIIWCIFKDSVKFQISNTDIEISVGDIFNTPGFKVIGCDTHFDTRVDDAIISKTSLHGQLVLNHGKVDEIKAVIEKKAKALELSKNPEGLYDFPLGTVIRYDSSVDNQTYLMLALTENRKMNGQYKAFTSIPLYEQMLRTMWQEIDGVYVYNDLAIPLLGTGISRFEGGGKSKDALLKCMLCTLNSSGISFTSKVRIIIFGDAKDISLYEYKDMFKNIPGN